MTDTLFIKISDISVSECQLKIKFDFSKELSKYFFKNSFEIFYDQNIENVDESILPFLRLKSPTSPDIM